MESYPINLKIDKTESADYCLMSLFKNDQLIDCFTFNLEYFFEWVEDKHYEWFIKHVISKKLDIDIEFEMTYTQFETFSDVISEMKKLYLTKI